MVLGLGEFALFRCSLYFGSFGRLRSNIFFSSFIFKRRKHANLVASFVEVIIYVFCVFVLVLFFFVDFSLVWLGFFLLWVYEGYS